MSDASPSAPRTPRTALVTGVTGQDGSYLAELLLARGYRVVGTTRTHGTADTWRIRQLLSRLELSALDLADASAVRGFVGRVAPHEVYHLAAASRVDRSWTHPMEALEANAGSTVHLMDALRHEAPAARLVIASSCEIFGRPDVSPQDERTPVRPASPYGVSKAAAYWLAANYREAYGLHVASAILYNHESPRRSETFVTRKITQAVARIAAGLETTLTLGNLEGRRDWGFAGDYAEAMWRMQQLDAPRDLVIGTGTAHTVRDFCERAFAVAGLDYRAHVVSDESLFRPVDATTLVADARAARAALDWEPRVDFSALVEMMVEGDRERVRGGGGV
ncbi:MAG: GDP-mannose 4,6-dehydratase [Gemmatimonadaceae bacterium]|nr:GDP-mannose 4,6-dehydratase [Gemmatimonadaceae bacterium]